MSPSDFWSMLVLQLVVANALQDAKSEVVHVCESGVKEAGVADGFGNGVDGEVRGLGADATASTGEVVGSVVGEGVGDLVGSVVGFGSGAGN
jgi:hypothetical protein